MKLILAQGNPGTQHANTRHNVGWLVLDAFAAEHDATFAHQPKFFADIATVTVEGEKVLLVKPTTFYNETGRAARALVDFYKLDPATDLLVIHDDLALPLGTIRVRQKGGDAGNNGVKSLNAHVGSDYWRIRIGIWNDLKGRMDDASFVLSTLSRDEHTAIIRDVSREISELATLFCTGKLSPTSRNGTKDTA